MTRKILSILLIEDNFALAKQICRFLEGVGWSIDYADRGQQGIALAESNQYDVIILDLNQIKDHPAFKNEFKENGCKVIEITEDTVAEVKDFNLEIKGYLKVETQ